MRSYRLIGALMVGGLGLAAFPGLAQSQVVTLTAANSNTGAQGLPGGGTLNDDGAYYRGNDADSGYVAPNGSGTSFVFNGPTLVGGAGGAVIGTDLTNTNIYQAGDGGNGLLSQYGSSVVPLVTVNSGTYTGGMGGAATGTGAQLIGGGGGSGLEVNNSTVIVNGGTFVGGNGGTTTDPYAFNYSAGPGLNANYNGIITINGGSFQGGYANRPGSDGDGIVALGSPNSAVNIYGGTFTDGSTSGISGTGYGINLEGGAVTLYGTDFAVSGGNATETNGMVTGSGTITGILENNGTPTSITFNNSRGTIDLVTVPEPSSLAVVSFSALGLAGMIRRKRKTSAEM